MARSYTRGADRTNHGGSGGLHYRPTFGVLRKLGLSTAALRGCPNDRNKKKLPKRVAKALGVAKGLMGGERHRVKVTAQKEARIAKEVPRGHKRIARRQADGTVVTRDLAIMGNAFSLLMIFVQRADVDGMRRVMPTITAAEIDFLLDGRVSARAENAMRSAGVEQTAS